MGIDRVVELELETVGRGGQALGRHGGKVVFVPGSIPGEVVRVRIVEERRRWSRAELLRVLEPSPHRVDAPCPTFGPCGGCHWQHMAYETQLAYKCQIVVDQLRRTSPLDPSSVRPVIGMQEPWFYRNHVQFSVSASGALGFQAARSHEVVPVERCLLLHSLLDELHAALDVDWPELLRLSLRAGVHTGEQMVILETAGDEIPELQVDIPLSCVFRSSDGIDYPLIGTSAYTETLRGQPFRVSASSFFQVNTAQAEVMLDLVEQFLDLDDVLLDLYCGVGTIGLSMADKVKEVIGVEEHPAAILDAVANAADAGEVTLIEGPAERVLPSLDTRITKAVLDPPRQGCKPEVLSALMDLAPLRIVHVSCNPSTFARDAAVIAKGGYRLVEVQPIDVFPQTHHIETVSLWQGVEAGS